MSPQFLAILGAAIVLVASTAAAMLVFATGLRRASILAGAFVGVLLGQTVAARVSPDWHERLFIGGVAQRLELERLRSRQGADVQALLATGVSETAVEELKTRHAEEIEPFIAAYNDAVHEHQLILWYLGLISAGLVFGWLAPGAKRSLVSPAQEGLFVAAWTTVFSVAVLGLLTVYVMNGSPLSGIALGITFAITGRPVARSLASVWKVTFGRDSVAIPGQDEAEGSTVDQRARLAIVRTAGISEAASAILWMVALFTLLFALVRFERLANPLVPGFFVAGVFCAKAFSGARPESKQGFSGVMVLGPLPTLAALAMLSIDLLSATLIVPALIALIVGSDARWFGAATGMRLTGARWMPALWFSTPLTDAGAMMLASGFLFWRAGWLDQPLLIAAIVGALICEFTVTLRPRLLERLSDSLDEEEQDEDEGADRTGDESEQ